MSDYACNNSHLKSNMTDYGCNNRISKKGNINSNKKSNHTFSSICSDDGMMIEHRNGFQFVLNEEDQQ